MPNLGMRVHEAPASVPAHSGCSRASVFTRRRKSPCACLKARLLAVSEAQVSSGFQDSSPVDTNSLTRLHGIVGGTIVHHDHFRFPVEVGTEDMGETPCE